MQHNIIDLQNQTDTAYIGNLNQDFILQSLANLGQRVGLKGDGIVYQNFTFYDMFSNITETQYSADKYIGVIKYDTDNITNLNIGAVGIIEKGKRYIDATSFESGIGVDDANHIISNGTTSTAISSNFIVNNIQSFLPYSVLRTDEDGKYFYNILFGQHINTNDSSTLPNIDVHYNKFRLSDNTLDTAIRVINISNTTTQPNYLMYVVNRSSDNDMLYNISAYCFKPEIFGDSVINQNIAQRFNNIFYSRTYSEAISSFGLTNLSIQALENPLDNILFFNKIATNNGLTDYNKHRDFSFYANVESNVFKPTGSDIVNLNKLLSAAYTNVDVNTLMHYLSNDVNVNFETIFTYFSHNQYNVDIHTLTKKIFFAIYDKIAETYNVSEKGVMYVPLDYKINVIVNSNKQLKFYYSNEFFVTNTNLQTLNDIEISTFFTNKNNNIVYDYVGVDMINVYNFSFNYNSTYTDLINSLNIKYIYALPSLSASNTWLINDKDTSIYAVGKDAGNPNIIINYNYEENGTLKYKVLNNVDDEIINSVNWVKTQYAVESSATKQYVYVPDITTANYKFEYALIFNINAQTNFISIWHVTDTGFDYIRKPNDVVAMNFKTLFDNSVNDVDNITASTLNNALYLTAIDYKIANSFDDISSNFSTIKNRSSYFYPTYDVNNPYNNNLNFDIRYKTNFNVNSYNYVENIEKSSIRYMDELIALQNTGQNAAKYVTNVTYPTIKTATGVITINKIADKTYKTVQYTTVQNIDTINIITVYSNNNNTDNTLTTTLNNQIKESLEIIRTSTSNTNAAFTIETNETTDTIEVTYNEVIKLDKSNFFNEYIPNSNVPTIDLGEVLTRNVDVLNRVNIISLNSEGKTYNSYFGTSVDDTDKSHLHIGTSNLNINIGKDTLLSYNNTSYFNTATELYDDIPTTFTKRTISYCNVNNMGNGFYDSRIKINGDVSYVFGYKTYNITNNSYNETLNISTTGIDKSKMFLNVIETNKSLINFSNISPISVDNWNNVINHADVGFDVNTKYANRSVPKEIVYVSNGTNVYRGITTTVDGLTTINLSQDNILRIKTDIPNYTSVKIIKLIYNGISTIDINDCEYCKLNNDGNIVFNNVSSTYIICVVTNDTDVKFYKIYSAANDIISTYINVNMVFKNLFGMTNPQFTDVLGYLSEYGLDKSKLFKIDTTLYYKLSTYNKKPIILKNADNQLYNEYLNFTWHDNGTIDVTIDTEHHDFNDDSDNYKNVILSDTISQITIDDEAIKNILGDNKL